MLFASNQKPLLDTVSTTCGSGWVRSLLDCHWLRTHPLPRTVLTVSKYDF